MDEMREAKAEQSIGSLDVVHQGTVLERQRYAQQHLGDPELMIK